MAAFRCGNCNEQTHFTPLGIGEAITVDVRGRDGILCQQALRCDMCKRLSIAYQIDSSLPYNGHMPESWVGFWSNVGKPHMYYPRPISENTFPNSPSHIAEAAAEAHKVHSISAYRATAILCRAVIEAVCKEQGANGKDLFHKIDDLFEQGLVRRFVKETAHVLRAIGNDMAHGDFDKDLTSDDADHVLGFMDSILDEIYESTAKLTKMKDVISQRKAAKDS